MSDGAFGAAPPSGVPTDASPWWDGSRWVVPAVGDRPAMAWDGSTWRALDALAPPASAAPPWPAGPAPGLPLGLGVPGPYPAPRPVSRGAIFGQLYWRTLVLASGGGLVVGFVYGAVLSVSERDGANYGPFVYMAFAGGFGAVTGVLLGLVAGFVTGGLCAWLLLPYRGRSATRLIALLVSVGCLLPFAVWGSIGWDYDAVKDIVSWVVLVGTSLVGAAVGSLWLVDWFVQRMRLLGHPDRGPLTAPR